jgi:bifunctional DNA-binding transcriptional regulator/antitoxin component of YhaV-PrlF toxin-antitoxin module
MTNSTTIQIRSKGTVTLPVELRRKYHLEEGDIITLIDLGEGALLLTSGVTQVDRLGDRVAQMLAEEDVAIDDLLRTLGEEREQYYTDHYAED